MTPAAYLASVADRSHASISVAHLVTILRTQASLEFGSLPARLAEVRGDADAVRIRKWASIFALSAIAETAWSVGQAFDLASDERAELRGLYREIETALEWIRKGAP